MTLESGDKLWMQAAPGQMTLQMCSHQHAGDDDMSARGRSDVAVLVGRDVARLLFALERGLRCTDGECEVLVGSRGGALKVEWSNYVDMISLIGDTEKIVLTQAEALMLMEAVKSISYKMFQY